MDRPAHIRDRLLIVMAVIALLYVGRTVLVPLCYSLLLAMVLYPIVARLERKGVPRALAIGAGLSIVVTLFSAIVAVLVWQMDAFLAHLPALEQSAPGVLGELLVRVQRTMDLMPAEGIGGWEAILSTLPEGTGSVLLKALDAVFGMVFNLFIIPIITVLLLLDRSRYVSVLSELVGASLRPALPDILQRSVHSFAAFITGTVKVYLIVGVLNSIGLALLGVENAIFFGMLSAFMTIIPYIGIVISSLLPMSVAWLSTGSIWHPLGVVVVYAAVQYLEANLIFPRVVGHQLHVNTLASIVIVLLGAVLWGVSGMILLLPFMAIVRIVAAEVPSMRAIEHLLGHERATRSGS